MTDTIEAPAPATPSLPMAAIRASCQWVEENIAPKRCDNEGVSDCWRCNTVFLARTLARLDEGSATPPITEQCQCGHTRAEHESRYDAPNHCTHRCAPPWIGSATPDQGKGEPR